MNKQFPPAFFVTLVMCLYAALAAGLQATTTPQEDISPENSSIFSSGNDNGVYLVVTDKVDDQQGFQIFYRGKVSPGFVAGNRYQGYPIGIAATNERLIIFFNHGHCRSYDLSATYTEQSVPAATQLIDCSSTNNNVYALTKNENGYSLWHHSKNKWQSAGNISLPLTDPNQTTTKIHVFGSTVHLLNIHAEKLWYQTSQLNQQSFSGPQLLSIDNVADASILTVNREVILIAVVSAADSNDSSSTADHKQNVEFRIGRQVKDNWSFSDPLKQTTDNSPSIFVAPIDKVSVAAFGQNIAIFQKCDNGEIWLRQYSPAGEILEKPALSLSVTSVQSLPFLQWMFSPMIVAAMIVVIAVLLFLYRKKAFGSQQPLPEYIQLASLWRRVLAFFIDGMTIFVISAVVLRTLQSKMSPELILEMSLPPEVIIQKMQSGIMPPQMLKLMTLTLIIVAVVSLFYFILCESFFHRTPGKLCMNLVVLDSSGKPMVVRQAVLRNILRLLECHPLITPLIISLIIILSTSKHQRIGDLVADTIVVIQTPTLIYQLNKPKQDNPDDYHADE
jgi:uncharacterized RDD family membrane protein YckC